MFLLAVGCMGIVGYLVYRNTNVAPPIDQSTPPSDLPKV